MGWLKDRKEKRKLKKYMKRTPEEEFAICSQSSFVNFDGGIS